MRTPLPNLRPQRIPMHIWVCQILSGLEYVSVEFILSSHPDMKTRLALKEKELQEKDQVINGLKSELQELQVNIQ